MDYHYVAAIAEDLYESLGAYKYSLLITPQTGALLGGLYLLKDVDEHVEKAKKFINDAKGVYQQVSNFVDKSVQNAIFGVDTNKLQMIRQHAEKIKIRST